MWRKGLISCLASVLVVGWCAVEAMCFSPIYVNAKTGKDLPAFGKTTGKPVKTIKYALSLADDNTTILCSAKAIFNESIVIEKNRITLKAQNSDSPPTIRGNGSGPVVSVQGPLRAAIQDFIVENGEIGILSESARLELTGVTVRKNGVGIEAEASNLLIRNSVVSANSTDGMYLRRNSTGKVENSQFTDNTGRGVYLKNNSQATILGSRALNNGDRGIACNLSSSAQIEDSEISGNKGDGLGVTRGSSAYLGYETGTIISGNGKSGVSVLNNSTVQAENLTVQGNTKWGVLVGHESSFMLEGGAITNTTDDGVLVYANSLFHLSKGSIEHNSGDGIEVQEGAVARFNCPGGCEVSQNGGFGIRCGQGGNAWNRPTSLTGNTLGECTSCPGICF